MQNNILSGNKRAAIVSSRSQQNISNCRFIAPGLLTKFAAHLETYIDIFGVIYAEF